MQRPFHLNRSSAQLDDPFHKGKAKAVSLCLAGIVPLIELFHHMLLHFLCHPVTMVGNRDGEQGLRLPDADMNDPVVRRVLDGIVQKVDPDLRQKLLAAVVEHSGQLPVLISIVITILGGLIQAKKAAKKDPVIALRTE